MIRLRVSESISLNIIIQSVIATTSISYLEVLVNIVRNVLKL